MARFGAKVGVADGFGAAILFTCMPASEAAALSSDITAFFSIDPAFEAIARTPGLGFVEAALDFVFDGDLAGKGAFFALRPGDARTFEADVGGGLGLGAIIVFEAAAPIVGFAIVFDAAFAGVLLLALEALARQVDLDAVFVPFLAFAAALNPRVIAALTRLSKT